MITREKSQSFERKIGVVDDEDEGGDEDSTPIFLTPHPKAFVYPQ